MDCVGQPAEAIAACYERVPNGHRKYKPTVSNLTSVEQSLFATTTKVCLLLPELTRNRAQRWQYWLTEYSSAFRNWRSVGLNEAGIEPRFELPGWVQTHGY